MNYIPQQVISEYNNITNIWILHIQNNIFSLNEALEKIKKQKKQIILGVKKDEYFAKAQDYLQ